MFASTVPAPHYQVTPGDGGFSAELEATTRAVAPAFPRITFVKVFEVINRPFFSALYGEVVYP